MDARQPIRFDGRVAIVTGAGAGLGRAHALHLAARGAKLVVNDLGVSLAGAPIDGQASAASPAEAVVAEIREAGGEAVASHESVSDPAAAERIVQTALDAFGRIDIVVNNAGILRDRTFAKMSLDDFRAVMDVHFMGTVYVTKAAWPHLLAQGYGRVVFTSSGAGLSGGLGQANYAAAKTAMVGLMNHLKREGAKSGVLVNIISPVAATRMTASAARLSMDADALAPEKVSPAVAWFCSEACDVTGRIVAAGGGYFAAVQMMRGKGAIIADGRAPTVDDFAENLERIFDLEGATPFERTLDPATRQALGLE